MTGFDDRYYASRDGLTLHYRYYGVDRAAMPAVCLPGITRNCRDFEDLAPHLAGQRPVIAVDFRGRGLSEPDPVWRNYHPETYVDDVVRLLDDAGVTAAVFIGTSLGGLVATVVAGRYPDRVAGVVLNDIGPEIGPRGLARIMSYLGRANPVANWSQAVAQAREIYAASYPGLDDLAWHRLARRAYRDSGDGTPVLDMDPRIGDAAREVGAGLGDPWQLFAALQAVPTLVLQGELSDILTDDIVARMQQAKPDLVHVAIPGRGHVPLLDEPQSLAAIDRFLEPFS